MPPKLISYGIWQSIMNGTDAEWEDYQECPFLLCHTGNEIMSGCQRNLLIEAIQLASNVTTTVNDNTTNNTNTTTTTQQDGTNNYNCVRCTMSKNTIASRHNSLQVSLRPSPQTNIHRHAIGRIIKIYG